MMGLGRGGEALSVSKRDCCEPLAVVEVDLDIENEDAAEEATHVELRAVTEMMHKANMAPPVYAASLTSNGVGLPVHFWTACLRRRIRRCSARATGARSPSPDSLSADRRGRTYCENHHPRARRFLAGLTARIRACFRHISLYAMSLTS